MAGDDSTIATDWRIVDAVDDEWASETLPDDGARARESVLDARRVCSLVCSLNGLDENVSTHAHRVDDGDDDGLD